MNTPTLFGLFDCLLFVVLVLFILYLLSNTRYTGIERKLLLRGFLLKAFATIALLVYYQYGQHGVGDIYGYYKESVYLSNLLYSDPLLFFKYIFSAPESVNFPSINPLVHDFMFEKDEAFVVKLGGIVSVFMQGSFLNISLIFSTIAYWGGWKIYQVYSQLYPAYKKPLGFAIVFAPSLVFWGTALTKDSICIGGLGFLIFALFHLFVFRKHIFRNLIVLMLCILIFLNVKIYILMAAFPSLMISFIVKFVRGIKNPLIKIILIPTSFVALILLVSFAQGAFQGVLEKYAFEHLAETIVTNYSYLSKETGAGSVYDLGKIEPTLPSVLSKFLPAVNVTLFRPYPWEIKNMSTVFAAIESLLTVFLTIFVLLRVGLIRSFRMMFSNTELLFSVLFCIIFAFAVGVTSGNFGTLIRYKIPLLPFYYSALVILYYENLHRKKEIRLS